MKEEYVSQCCGSDYTARIWYDMDGRAVGSSYLCLNCRNKCELESKWDRQLADFAKYKESLAGLSEDLKRIAGAQISEVIRIEDVPELLKQIQLDIIVLAKFILKKTGDET